MHNTVNFKGKIYDHKSRMEYEHYMSNYKTTRKVKVALQDEGLKSTLLNKDYGRTLSKHYRVGIYI